MVRFRDLPMMLDVKTCSAILNLDERTCTRLCVRGEFKAVKVGAQWRINRDALLELIDIDPESLIPNSLFRDIEERELARSKEWKRRKAAQTIQQARSKPQANAKQMRSR